MCPIDVPSRRVLDETPPRVYQFLHFSGRDLTIHAALAAAGLTEAERDLGWDLLRQVDNLKVSPLGAQIDPRIRDAMTELDAWDEPHMARIAATVTRLHPDQFDALLDTIEPQSGPASIIGIERLLDRLDAFEKSADEQQHAVVATLASRGYDAAERARLRALVKVAKSGSSLAPTVGDPDGEREQSLLALYRWYREWSATARAVIDRRDQLIKLGLASRHTQKGDDEPAPTPPAPTPAPTPAAPTPVPA